MHVHTCLRCHEAYECSFESEYCDQQHGTWQYLCWPCGRTWYAEKYRLRTSKA